MSSVYVHTGIIKTQFSRQTIIEARFPLFNVIEHVQKRYSVCSNIVALRWVATSVKLQHRICFFSFPTLMSIVSQSVTRVGRGTAGQDCPIRMLTAISPTQALIEFVTWIPLRLSYEELNTRERRQRQSCSFDYQKCTRLIYNAWAWATWQPLDNR